MKVAWHWLKLCITRDDLFLRVLFFLFGAVLGGGGMYGVCRLVAGGFRSEPAWLQAIAWAIAVLFCAWGSFLLARSVLRSDSRVARIAEKFAPDSADEGALVLLLAFCLPAVLFTIVLRLLGVRGQVTLSRSSGEEPSDSPLRHNS